MRILFITGSLEPEADGVGDYTRRLAGAVSLQGVETRLLALNDRKIESCWEGNQMENGTSLHCLRLPATLDWAERVRVAEEWVAGFNPDWVSLQFVCFAFHPRGLVKALAGRLRTIVGARRLHVMFHEIWIGMAGGIPWNHRVVGWVQKRQILQMVRDLQPKVMHANATVYVEILRRAGIANVERLPLFSNVPLAARDDRLARAVLAEHGLALTESERKNVWLFCHFGSLAPEMEAEPLFTVVGEACRQHSRRGIFVFAGNAGRAGEAVIERLREEYGRRFTFLRTGPIPAERLSALLSFCDFGLTASPPEMAEKSGSVAAALTHGLPVLIARTSLRWPFPLDRWRSSPRLLAQERFAEFPSMAKQAGEAPALEDVARQFIRSLGIDSMPVEPFVPGVTSKT